jgi:hypothetical protein
MRMEGRIKKIISRISQASGIPETRVAQGLFGFSMLLVAVVIFQTLSSDNEIDCDSDGNIALVKQIVNDSNPFVRPESITLAAIRTTDRDDKLKRSSCAAQASIKYFGVPAVSLGITYTIESTSDGVYGTVYGL